MAHVGGGSMMAQWFALSVVAVAGTLRAASPTVEQALKLSPVQEGVEFDRPAPADVPRCTLAAEKAGDQTGWAVRGPAGETLRQFVDTNGDNVVDRWSYHENGLEVYRDIDADFNGKADQYRWLNTAGSRWGLDKDEDGTIDAWKSISAEEAATEAVLALANRDKARFARLLLEPDELRALGLGQAMEKALLDKIEAAPAAFANSELPPSLFQSVSARPVDPLTEPKVHFGGTRPGIVPAGTEGSASDLLVYENVVAMFDVDGRQGHVQIGTLIEVGRTWRLIDAPQLLDDSQTELAGRGFFFRPTLAARADAAGAGGAGTDGKMQQLLADLESLDPAEAKATTPEERAQVVKRRLDLLEQLAETAGSREDRDQWLRQSADTASAAVQSWSYADGVSRLKSLVEKLEQQTGNEDLVGYVKFRILTAEYAERLQGPNPNFVEVQAWWLKSLDEYITDHPNGPDTSEAMLQLAIAEEFAGQDDEAKKWYGEVVDRFPSAPSARKAAGARTRLDCVGKEIQLRGTSPTGKKVDLAQFRKKVVLVHYWATWCEPCKADLVQIKDLQAKYGKDGLAIIGVSLDSRKEDLVAYLKRNPLPWAHIFEAGGLDSRLANELGILTLPTMLLVDQQGKVVNRSVHVTELDREVKALLR